MGYWLLDLLLHALWHEADVQARLGQNHFQISSIFNRFFLPRCGRACDQCDDYIDDDLMSLLNTSSPPLAERMRPARLEDLVGQEHLVGATGIIRKAISTGNVPSMILW